MVEPIIDIIVTELQSKIAWVDRIAGIAETIRQQMQTEGGVEEKVLPAYWGLPSNCSDPAYVPLTPDTSKKSVIYFDNVSESQTYDNRYYSVYSCNCRLVVWLNKPMINPGSSTYQYEQELFEAIPYHIANFNPFTWIRVYPGQWERGSGIMSAWSYNEAEQQYSTYPYDCFALNLEIVYRINKACASPVTNNPNVCLKY